LVQALKAKWNTLFCDAIVFARRDEAELSDLAANTPRRDRSALQELVGVP